jgi:excisionase family DNA binding protein
MPVCLDKRLLDAKKAADYLSISRALLYQWNAKGKIPSVRINSRRLFDVLDLDQFVDSLKTSVNNE